MKNKKEMIFILAMLLLGSISLVMQIHYVSAATTSSTQAYWCAEHTKDGHWCQNVPYSDVDTSNGYQKAQTSCSLTSFCKTGTCVSPSSGECDPNVPQRVCTANNGVWFSGSTNTIPQCKLGCCVVGDQTAFTTQIGCKGIETKYGVSGTFRSDITDQTSCLQLANTEVKGACVLDDGITRNCKITTKGDCNTLQSTYSNETVTFNPGLLCTAPQLNTDCAKTTKTTCLPDKYGVYYLDSCGNVANIYDTQRYNDPIYWTNIINVSASCNPNSPNGNANSPSCGNCNYISGSLCKPYQRGSSETPVAPQQGSNVCADLSCNYNGQTYQHGETWCGNSPGISTNSPGSDSYLLSCFNGEVTATLCGTGYRNSICRQNVTNAGYTVAACVANLWEDCTNQTNKAACEDSSKRDCTWITGVSVLQSSKGSNYILNKSGDLVPQPSHYENGSEATQASCVPLYPPGFNLTAQTANSTATENNPPQTACYQASQNCQVKFIRNNAFTGWKCTQNCQCLSKDWEKQRMTLCVSLGDCGNKTNLFGVEGQDLSK